MEYLKLRKALNACYSKSVERSEAFYEKCMKILEQNYSEDMTALESKMMQYQIISENFEPVIIDDCPFYFETGTMFCECDGARIWRHGYKHPGGFTYWKKEKRFVEQDRELYEQACALRQEIMYLICGTYNDTAQHFVYDYRPVLNGGLKSIYERAEKLKQTADEKQKKFLEAVCVGLLAIKQSAEKFGKKAQELIEEEKDPDRIKNLERIIESSKTCPWEAPKNLYEALNTIAFMRKMVGTLEGIGTGTFGRLDIDLYKFYKNDIESKLLTKEQAKDLIANFLLLWDCCYDHDMKMVSYADHEMEATYTIGGVDEFGVHVYNELTEIFLTISGEEKIIFPKIKCRFDKNSPKEYLDLINKYVLQGTSTVLYQNDEATIAALLRAGYTETEARDYIIAGCWDLNVIGKESVDGGTYLNMLKPFEFSIHNLTDKIQKVGLDIKGIDNAKTFEEIYQTTLQNIKLLFEKRAKITRLGGNVWHEVDPLPIFSSSLDGLLERGKDFTEGGAKYNAEHYLCFGLPNIIDSLMAIKELCFDQKKYTLEEFLTAVRNNWEGQEIMRIDAMRCHGWGDGSSEASMLANRFNNDLYAIAETLVSTRGGKVRVGHLTYTEIRWWGEATLATPDGRKNGEYFAQGLTPSRLKKIPSVTDAINSLSCLDPSVMAGNSVVNIILPSNKITLDKLEAFIRSVAGSAIQSLQLNCVTKEQLLDAQIHPEKYPNLIVRVTGFSARFTALSPEWQEEVLTRNFYK